MCSGNCCNYYDPSDGCYHQIGCNYCKKYINEVAFNGQLHKIRFICDESHHVEPFMKVVYRYRNWYGSDDEFIYESVMNPHYDFMKLCVDSNEIKKPVVYEAMGCYNGLSENGNPLWIILGNVKKITQLEDIYEECLLKPNMVCNECHTCKYR